MVDVNNHMDMKRYFKGLKGEFSISKQPIVHFHCSFVVVCKDLSYVLVIEKTNIC